MAPAVRTRWVGAASCDTRPRAVTGLPTLIFPARPRADAIAGGVIRTVVIDKDGVTRDFVPGDKLPFMLA